MAYINQLSAAFPGEDINLGNILFVSEEGDNDTAEKGSLSKTWRDPWEAIASAVNGDYIYVFPGVWTFGPGGYRSSGVENILGINLGYTQIRILFSEFSYITGNYSNPFTSVMTWNLNADANINIVGGVFSNATIGVNSQFVSTSRIEINEGYNLFYICRTRARESVFSANYIEFDDNNNTNTGLDSLANFGQTGAAFSVPNQSFYYNVKRVYAKCLTGQIAGRGNGAFKGNNVVSTSGSCVFINIEKATFINYPHLGIPLSGNNTVFYWKFGSLEFFVDLITSGALVFDNANFDFGESTSAYVPTNVLGPQVLYSSGRTYTNNSTFILEAGSIETHVPLVNWQSGTSRVVVRAERLKCTSGAPFILVKSTNQQITYDFSNVICNNPAQVNSCVNTTFLGVLNIRNTGAGSCINYKGAAPAMYLSGSLSNSGLVPALSANVPVTVNVFGLFQQSSSLQDINATINRIFEYGSITGGLTNANEGLSVSGATAQLGNATPMTKNAEIVGQAGFDAGILLFDTISIVANDEIFLDALNGVSVNQGLIKLGGNSVILAGTGSPEGVITANVGSMFLRSDGGAGTTLYVKETGSGNTGWTAK